MDSRENIEAEIQSLRQRRGAALVAGRKFDNTTLVEAEQKLAALDDVAAEKARLDREEAAKQRQAEVTAAKAEIEDLKAASAKALADSRAGYVQGASAMRLHLQTEASLRKAQAKLNQLTGEKTPIVNEFELARQRSLQIVSVGLKPINNHPSRFGRLEWPMSIIEWKD